MRGVYFGDYHTVTDWELILSAKTINPPTPKRVKVNIDGRDGTLDLSRALTGEMKYENREASFTFLATEGSYEERNELIKTITRAIHGKELQIIEPDNEGYYLVGECSVDNVVNNKAYGSITIKADCEPYYLAINEVKRILAPSDKPYEVILSNAGDKILTPTLTVDGTINLEFGTSKVSLSSGTYTLTGLRLQPGNTVISMTGSGFTTVSYREAVLF